MLMYEYLCPHCGFRWSQENFFEREACIRCGRDARCQGPQIVERAN